MRDRTPKNEVPRKKKEAERFGSRASSDDDFGGLAFTTDPKTRKKMALPPLHAYNMWWLTIRRAQHMV